VARIGMPGLGQASPGAGAGSGPGSAQPLLKAEVGVHNATVASGARLGEVDFGNFQLASLSGVVYNDLDGDGMQDAGETELPDTTVFLDLDGDTIKDDDEPFRLVGADGRYSFAGLGPRSYDVRSVLPEGWSITAPAGDKHTVTMTSGLESSMLDFGQRDRPPVAVDDIGSGVAGSIITGNVLTNDSDPGRPDNSLLTAVKKTDPANGTVTVAADGSFSYTPNAGYEGPDSFTYTVGDGAGSDEGEVRLTVRHDNLRVASLAGRHDGFTVQFSRPIAQSNLDANGSDGDVVLLDSVGHSVPGTLFVAADGRSARFLASGSVLPDGSYSVRLVAGAAALRDLSGIALDGNADGTAGDNHLGSFSVARGDSLTVGLGDIARGPEQAMGAGMAGDGIGVRLSNGSGVNTVAFSFNWDPALLVGVTLARGGALPAGASFTATAVGSGRIDVLINAPGGLPAGGLTIAQLSGQPPAGASYGAAQVLDIQGVFINGSSRPQGDDDAVHVAAFAGDLTRDRALDSGDLTLMNQLLAGSAQRAPMYPLIDHRLLGDVNGSGLFDALDPMRLQQHLAGTPNVVVPIPGAPTPAPPPPAPAPPGRGTTPTPPAPPAPRPRTPAPAPVPGPGGRIEPLSAVNTRGWLAPMVSVPTASNPNAAIRITL